MTNSPEWTFAYGSNMSIDDLQAWFAQKGHTAARVERVEPATLPGYRLIWNYYSNSRKGGAANVERAAGQILPGVALLVSCETLSAIDKKEGHPKYYSRGEARVPVQLADGTSIDAWLYVAVADRCRSATVPPRRAYLDIMILAAERVGLPAEHVAILRATPTADDSNG